jgi:hypothetical protein
VGDFGGAGQLVEAQKNAHSFHYDAIGLRLLGTIAFDELFKGKQRIGLSYCRDGLSRYWSGSLPDYYARVLYWNIGFGSEKVELWHLAEAADYQEIEFATNNQDPLSLAIEHTNVARVSVRASDSDAAQAHLKIAETLLSSVPDTDVTENYRLTAESYSALVDGQLGRPEDGLVRLERSRPRLNKIANTNVVADFFRIEGELQSLAGNLTAAEAALANAVAMGEKMRRSLRSESDQISWRREWSKPYLDLVEIELQRGNSSKALALWQLYRDSRLIAFPVSDVPTLSEAEAAVASTNLLISQESELIERVFSNRQDQTALILAVLPHGLAVWTYDDRGLYAKLINNNPADIRLQVQSLAELCADPSSSLNAIQSTGRALYGILVAPVSDRLRQRQTLVVEADDIISAVPFQVLLDNSGNYLGDQHPVTYLPVLSDLDRIVSNFQRAY